MKKKITKKVFFDTIFIAAYSVGTFSLLKYVTYALFPISEAIQLFLFSFIIYIVRFGGKVRKRRIVGGNLMYTLVCLYIWEMIQGVVVGTSFDAILVSGVNLLSTFVAFKYMNNLICDYSSINPVLDAFSRYYKYTIFVVITSSILIFASILSPFSNELSANSLLKSNMEISGTSYFFPGFLSVVYNTPSVCLSALNFPSLSGLSHESQAMYFTIYPALFLLYRTPARHRERNVIYIFLITTILTTSLTAAVCFMITYSLHLVWKSFVKKQLSSTFVFSFVFCVLVIIVILSQLGTYIGSYVQDKASFDTAGSSGAYSLSLLSYIVSPKGILGQGIYGSSSEIALLSSGNCGYISSCIIIVFYIVLFCSCIKNVFSKNTICHSIGLASFYFFAHSFKYGVQIFNSNYIFFIVFLLSYAEQVTNNEETKLKRCK